MKIYGQVNRGYGSGGYGKDVVHWCPPPRGFTDGFEDQVSLTPSYIEQSSGTAEFADTNDNTTPAEPCEDEQ